MVRIGILLVLLLLAVVPASAQENEVRLTLERTPCFGSCPVYTVAIYADGTVVYEGESSVIVEGRQTTQIAPETVVALVEGFEATGYFEWEDSYDAFMVTDQSSVITSVTRDGETKTIHRYGGDNTAPIELLYLETWIDKAVNTQQWTGKEPYSPNFITESRPVIGLKRGACSDDEACPSYLLNLYDDGLVIYVGMGNVAQLGVRSTSIEPEAVAALAEEMAKQGYFEWQDEYTDKAENEEPTIITTFAKWDDQNQQIIRYAGDTNAPQALIELEAQIDEAVNVAQWIEPSDSP